MAISSRCEITEALECMKWKLGDRGLGVFCRKRQPGPVPSQGPRPVPGAIRTLTDRQAHKVTRRNAQSPQVCSETGGAARRVADVLFRAPHTADRRGHMPLHRLPPPGAHPRHVTRVYRKQQLRFRRVCSITVISGACLPRL